MFLQETYGIYDCQFYDDGTVTSNSLWRLNNATLTRSNSYTTVKSTAQWGSIYLGKNNVQANLLENNNGIIIELDLLNNNSHTNFNLRYNDGTNRYLALPQMDGHHKVTIAPTRQIFEVDGVVKQDWTVTLPNLYLQSFADASGLEFQFKELKIYPV